VALRNQIYWAHRFYKINGGFAFFAMPRTLLFLPNFDLPRANFAACFLGGKVCGT